MCDVCVCEGGLKIPFHFQTLHYTPHSVIPWIIYSLALTQGLCGMLSAPPLLPPTIHHCTKSGSGFKPRHSLPHNYLWYCKFEMWESVHRIQIYRFELMIYLYILHCPQLYWYNYLIFCRLHISALHKFTYGKHILAKLENYYANNPWEKSSVKIKEKVNWNPRFETLIITHWQCIKADDSASISFEK